MLLANLKQQTKAYHDGLDRSLDIFNRIDSIEAYRQLLGRFFGFYLPMETALSQIMDLQALNFKFSERRKISWLENDLNFLAAPNSLSLPICHDLPELAAVAHALGCLYVLEGATLGGQLITQHLKKTLGLTPSQGIDFFNSYGDQVGAMWTLFCTTLSDYSVSHSHDEIIIGAACDTFKKIACWLHTA